jgi:Mn-containing catalase
MFYHDKKLQYPVRVEKPNPLFAKMLQQAIGGIEGEIRVMMQYMFQGFNARGPAKYRDMLLDTGTEEMAHIEMLATAVALNLEGAPVAEQEKMGSDPIIQAVMGGMNPRHILSAGLGAMPVDATGVPFNASWVVATGNIAADMYANVTAEAGGRTLAARLWGMTDDPGMKDMLSFLIARDTMHQNQWLAVLEELEQPVPVPNSVPEHMENTEFSYTFFSTLKDGGSLPEGRFTSGKSIDGHGQFKVERAKPMGQEPKLAPAEPESFGQIEQMMEKDMAKR